MYSSFRVPGFEVGADKAQRDTAKRVQALGVGCATISGKRVLDLGCNAGAIIFSVQEYMPSDCLGIEFDSDKVAVAEDIAAYCGLKNVMFRAGDLDCLRPGEIGEYDVVFCLAVERHVRDRARLYWFLGEVTRDLLYFEGNRQSDVEEIRNALQANGFPTVTYLGVCDDDYLQRNNRRPLFVAYKSR